MAGSAIDVTNITRVFGCTRNAYFTRDNTYDSYTLYLVRDDTDHNGVHGAYTEAYYGDKRVTDVLVIDKHEYNILIDTARNQSYPDDKIYLVPYYSEDVRRLSGQLHTAPIGYNICFKHDGIVTPICQSAIAAVEYDYDTDNISIVFNCEDGEKRVVVYQGAAFTYVVEVVEDEDNPGTYLANKSPQEIRDAYDAGRVIVCIYDDQALYLIKSEYDENDTSKRYATFGVVPSISFPDEYVLNIKILEDSHAEVVSKNIAYLVPFDINVLTEDTVNRTVTLDQTYADILLAVQSHKRVTVKYLDGTLLHFQEINEDDEISFAGIYDDGFIYIKVKSTENKIHKKSDNRPEGYPLLGLSGKLDPSLIPTDSSTFSLMAKIHLIDILRNVLYKAPVDLDNLLKELLGENVDYGKCGENVSWYYIDGVLYILGSGPMYPSYDPFNDDPAPWDQYKDNIVEVYIGEGVTYTSSYAFYNHGNLRKITVPSSITRFGASFYGCTNLEEVDITDIDAWCRITSDGNSVAPSIGQYMVSFPTYYSHRLYVNGEILTEIVIPDDIVSTGQGNFQNCTDITSITLPESLNFVNNHYFSGCTSVEDIYIYMKDGAIIGGLQNNSFSGSILPGNSVNVHIMSIEDYCSLDIVNGIISNNNTSNPSKVNLILDGDPDPSHLVIEDGKIVEVVIPNTITSLKRSLFKNSGVRRVTIPNTVTSLGNNEFCLCKDLTDVVFESGSIITNIPSLCFAWSDSLENVNFPDTIEVFGNGACIGCHSLLMSRLPTNTRVIYGVYQYSPFYDCPSITLTQIPNAVTVLCSFEHSLNVNLSIYHPYLTDIGSLRTTLSTANVIPPFASYVRRNPFAYHNITEIYFTTDDSVVQNLYVSYYLIEPAASLPSTVTDIYVPWSEGDVGMVDAYGVTQPWSSPTGTITHYNTVCVNSVSELSGKPHINNNCAVVTTINGSSIRYDRYDYSGGSWVFTRKINEGTLWL